MYTEVMPAIASRLREDGMPEEWVNSLSQLGHCTQDLVHRGTIDVSTSYPDAPSFPAGDTDLGWGSNTFTNHTSEYNEDTGNVDGGYTINAPGVSYFTVIITAGPIVVGGVKYEPQTVTVVTDVQYDATSHKFQKKTRALTFLGTVAAESGWTDVYTAQELTYVVYDVDYDTTSNDLTQARRQSVYVLEDGSDLGYNTVDEAEAC